MFWDLGIEAGFGDGEVYLLVFKVFDNDLVLVISFIIEWIKESL